MQEFLLLIHGSNYKDESPEALKVHLEKYQNWVEELLKEDKYVMGSRLQNFGKAIINNGNTIVSDGPYLESKELVGGYIIIKAKDLNEATLLASKCPLAEELPVSVRPMFIYD